MIAGIFLVLSVVFAIYGIVIASLNSGTYFFLIWFLIAAIFFTVGLGLKKGWLDKMNHKIKVVLLVLVVLFVGSFIFVEKKIMSEYLAQGKPELDYIIVLGAQVRENGPSKVLQWRLDKAIAYLEENPDTKVIVSGGQGHNEPAPEAEIMRDYLVQKKVSEEKIIVEDQSHSTKENLENSKELIEEGSQVGLVTNNFHVYRSLLIAEEVGYENMSGISAKSTFLYLPNNLLREYLALLKFYVTK